jgi:hypothetical protein
VKRVERARLIRDKLLFDSARDWELIRVGDKTVAQLGLEGMNAVLWNHSRIENSVNQSLSLAQPNRGRVRHPPHSMDLWVRGRRVMSIAWSEADEITLERMERGEWEVDFFGLPAPPGRARPALH